MTIAKSCSVVYLSSSLNAPVTTSPIHCKRVTTLIVTFNTVVGINYHQGLQELLNGL